MEVRGEVPHDLKCIYHRVKKDTSDISCVMPNSKDLTAPKKAEMDFIYQMLWYVNKMPSDAASLVDF